MEPLQAVPVVLAALSSAMSAAKSLEDAVAHVRTPFPVSVTVEALFPVFGEHRLKLSFSPDADVKFEF